MLNATQWYDCPSEKQIPYSINGNKIVEIKQFLHDLFQRFYDVISVRELAIVL